MTNFPEKIRLGDGVGPRDICLRLARSKALDSLLAPPWMAHNRPAPPGCARGRARWHPNRLAAFQPNSAARAAQFSWASLRRR
jgi:hypothetical protein